MLEVTSFDDNVLDGRVIDRSQRKLPSSIRRYRARFCKWPASLVHHEFPGLTLIKGSERGWPSTSETVSPIRYAPIFL